MEASDWEGPELSVVIAKLRSSLTKAQEEGIGKNLRFTIEDIEIELQLGITKDAKAEGGVRFWVVEAKAGGTLSNVTTQKIKLRMKLADDGATNAASDDTDPAKALQSNHGDKPRNLIGNEEKLPK